VEKQAGDNKLEEVKMKLEKEQKRLKKLVRDFTNLSTAFPNISFYVGLLCNKKSSTVTI
jgi:hypothetical protein